MVRIDVTTLISRPVQEVWEFFIDFTNSSHWTRSGSELRKTSDGPFGVGTTVESVRPMFGREIKSQRPRQHGLPIGLSATQLDRHGPDINSSICRMTPLERAWLPYSVVGSRSSYRTLTIDQRPSSLARWR